MPYLFTFLLSFFLYSFSASLFAKSDNETIQDWSVSCSPKCSVSQTLTDGVNALKYNATLVKEENTDKLLLRVQLPLGMYLPANIGIKVGDVDDTFPFITCVPNGCFAIYTMNTQWEEMLRSGNSFKLRFYSNQNTPNEIEFTNKGLSEALMRLN